MSKDILVRPYQPGDEEEIVKLLQGVFDGWPHFDLRCAPLDHWKWKFEDNPLRMKAISVCTSNNRIIGCSHGYYLKVKIGKKVFLCQHGTDIAVLQEYRSMGISNKMNEIKYELHKKVKANLTFSLSNNPILIRHDIKRGRPRFPYPILNLVRINDINLHFRSNKAMWVNTLKRYGFHLLGIVNRFKNKLIRPQYSYKTKLWLQISHIKQFDERINLFWDKIKDDYSFIIKRNLEYLNWRYCDPRGGDYIVKQAEENGEIFGYIVLRINRYQKDYPIGYIVDIVTLPNRLDVADALISDSISFFNSQLINIIHFWIIKNHPYEKIVNRYNFLNIKGNEHLFFTPLDIGSEIDDFLTAPAKRLHFQYGDADGI